MYSKHYSAQRQAILRAIKTSPGPISADEIGIRLVNSSKPVGPATIYRNLDWLTQRGEIHKFLDTHGIARYIGHCQASVRFRCHRCKAEIQLPRDQLETPLQTIIQPHGQIAVWRLEASGVCWKCQPQETSI